MTALLKDKKILEKAIKQFNELVYGKDNSRLEVVLEQYYRLTAEKQTLVVVLSFFTALILSLVILGMYFSSMYKMQKELELAVVGINKLNRVQNTYKEVDEDYKRFLARLEQSSGSSSILSVIDQRVKEIGLQVSDFPTQVYPVDFSANNPLSGTYQKAAISFRINRVSLKKLILFISAIHHSTNMIEVTSLEIQQIFGNKLYFDVKISADGFVLNQK